MTSKVKPVYHLLFWIFIFFWVFDYHIYGYDIATTAGYCLIEVILYSTICYVNLHVLIPEFLQKKNWKVYAIVLVLFLGILYVPYYYSGLGFDLLGDTETRILISFTLNFTLFIIFSFIYWYLTLFQQERHKTLSLTNEKLQAELLLLKSQVSPHFLFNSLNNIYSLSIVKNENAPIMIEKLSDILRYIIYEGSKNVVLLEREAELVQNYIDLHLLKKPKGKQNIAFQVNGLTGEQRIAPLLFINLIENCFEHSDVVYNADAHLKIDLQVVNDVLHFSTKNSYQKRNKKKGIGLENTKQQLEHYYPNAHTIIVEDTSATFKVKLTINL